MTRRRTLPFSKVAITIIVALTLSLAAWATTASATITENKRVGRSRVLPAAPSRTSISRAAFRQGLRGSLREESALEDLLATFDGQPRA